MPKRGSITSTGIGIYLTQLGLIDVHPAISKTVLAEIEAITHKIDMVYSITPQVADQFLLSHPIQCIRHTEERYYCVSGLRSLQIARCLFKDTDKVPILLLTGLGTDSPSRLAIVDTYVSSVVFGLDDVCWDLSIRNLLKAAVNEGEGLITPKLDARFARDLDIDKRRLSKKYKRPESQVKKLSEPAPGNE